MQKKAGGGKQSGAPDGAPVSSHVLALRGSWKDPPHAERIKANSVVNTRFTNEPLGFSSIENAVTRQRMNLGMVVPFMSDG